MRAITGRFAFVFFCASAFAGSPPAADEIARRVIDHYHNAKTYRSNGILLHIHRYPSGERTVETFERFEVAMDRSSGIKLGEHRFSGNFISDQIAWGPLSAIQTYREDRDSGFLHYVERRPPEHRDGYWGEFFTGGSVTPPAWVIGGLLVNGGLMVQKISNPTYEIESRGEATVLVQHSQSGGYPIARELTLTPAGDISEVRTNDEFNEVIIRFEHQTFGGTVASSDLEFHIPDYEPAFNQSSTLDSQAKKELMQRLADGGDRDAKVRILLADTASGATPSPERFAEIVRKLQEAEALGFGLAYVMHGQMLQPDNRSWFPPDLANLSDDELRKKQRAVYFDGAANCSGESQLALLQGNKQPLSTDEEASLKKDGQACWEKFSPSEAKKAQAELDRTTSGKQKS